MGKTQTILNNFSNEKTVRSERKQSWMSVIFSGLMFLTLTVSEGLSCDPAVTVGTTTTGTRSGAGSTLSISHTVSTKTDRLLMVGISFGSTSGGATVTGVTYGGQTLQLLPDSKAIHSIEANAEIWYIVAPASGTANVVVTWDVENVAGVVGVTSFSGVEQTTSFGVPKRTTGDGAMPSIIVQATVTGERVYDTVSWRSTSGTVDPSQTLAWNLNAATSYYGAGSNKAASEPDTTMSWTLGSVQPYAITGVAIKSSGSGTGSCTSPCGETITLIEAEKWYSVSRPCGLVNNPTVAELFNAAPGLGVYGTNWGLWKLDGTNPGYTNSESHTLLADDAEVMKSGVGYWMWSDTNVTWDPGAIATLADPTGSSWNVPTVDTNTTVELNITDPDVSAFYVVTPIADLKVGLIRDTQEVLLGNPFNKAITWENVYFSSDNGNTYKRADANTTSGIRHTAWVTNQDHTGSAVYPYEPISTTVGFKHTIEANQAFWIEVNGGWAAHPSERLAIPLEN